MTSLPK